MSQTDHHSTNALKTAIGVSKNILKRPERHDQELGVVYLTVSTSPERAESLHD